MLPKVTKMQENKASNKNFTDVFIQTGRIQYIVIALIITGFILFGQVFINWWAGDGYESAYIIACILMIPITIPLIQNIGLSILQAKNLYKYRTLIFLGISVVNVLISIPLTKWYSGLGAAIGTALSLLVGQGIVLNIYYHKKVKLDMVKFWKNIIKMTIPIIGVIIFGVLLNKIIVSNSIVILGFKIVVYSIVYCIVIWNFSMNNYEKGLVINAMKKLRIVREEK